MGNKIIALKPMLINEAGGGPTISIDLLEPWEFAAFIRWYCKQNPTAARIEYGPKNDKATFNSYLRPMAKKGNTTGNKRLHAWVKKGVAGVFEQKSKNSKDYEIWKAISKAYKFSAASWEISTSNDGLATTIDQDGPSRTPPKETGLSLWFWLGLAGVTVAGLAIPAFRGYHGKGTLGIGWFKGLNKIKLAREKRLMQSVNKTFEEIVTGKIKNYESPYTRDAAGTTGLTRINTISEEQRKELEKAFRNPAVRRAYAEEAASFARNVIEEGIIVKETGEISHLMTADELSAMFDLEPIQARGLKKYQREVEQAIKDNKTVSGKRMPKYSTKFATQGAARRGFVTVSAIATAGAVFSTAFNVNAREVQNASARTKKYTGANISGVHRYIQQNINRIYNVEAVDDPTDNDFKELGWNQDTINYYYDILQVYNFKQGKMNPYVFATKMLTFPCATKITSFEGWKHYSEEAGIRYNSLDTNPLFSRSSIESEMSNITSEEARYRQDAIRWQILTGGQKVGDCGAGGNDTGSNGIMQGVKSAAASVFDLFEIHSDPNDSKNNNR